MTNPVLTLGSPPFIFRSFSVLRNCILPYSSINAHTVNQTFKVMIIIDNSSNTSASSTASHEGNFLSDKGRRAADPARDVQQAGGRAAGLGPVGCVTAYASNASESYHECLRFVLPAVDGLPRAAGFGCMRIRGPGRSAPAHASDGHLYHGGFISISGLHVSVFAFG